MEYGCVTWKPAIHTKSHTVRGKPTLKLVEHFGNRSVSELYERSSIEQVGIYQCFLVVNPCVLISVRHTYQTILNFNWVHITEKNSGPTPTYIDPHKTITAPYSQASELVFGQSSGQQCVAMNLCSLIYNK